jgi:serine phosphatase RsbU (regulator of sigma subunit)
VMADELAVMLDADDVCFLITDLTGQAVARFGGTDANAARQHQRGARHAPVVRLEGSVYERVLRTQQPDWRPLGEGVRLIVPVTDRGDAMGLIELHLPWQADEEAVAEIAAAARALAYVVVGCRRHTDLFEWAQRSLPFSLAAEIQRRLLPSAFTCEAGQFTVAGWLEPANAVGGDTFDYALDRDTLHVSITDAVGHDVHAATLATVLVGALRHGRRSGMSLAEQARHANESLVAHSPIGDFATGQLLRIDLGSGLMSVVNAGHPRPLRIRNSVVSEIDLEIDLPFGLVPGRSLHVQQVRLQPGDRLALVTDGLLEGRAERLDLPALLASTAHDHPWQVVRRVGEDVIHATGGDLRDDATIVCLDWRGGPSRIRDATSGAHRQPG